MSEGFKTITNTSKVDFSFGGRLNKISRENKEKKKLNVNYSKDGQKFISPYWNFKPEQMFLIRLACKAARMLAEDLGLSEEKCIEYIMADFLAGVGYDWGAKEVIIELKKDIYKGECK